MAITINNPSECPRCESINTMERDHYDVTDICGRLVASVISLDCKECGSIFTEYYDDKGEYTETYMQLDD